MMTDAELMTTEPDVPGLELKIASWDVIVNKWHIGTVYAPFSVVIHRAELLAGESLYFPTRNDAVQWILAQHKVSE